jgi:hypothetical protein
MSLGKARATAAEVTAELLLDKETVERISDIQKMDPDTKNILFNVIDTYIQNFKTKKAFAK